MNEPRRHPVDFRHATRGRDLDLLLFLALVALHALLPWLVAYFPSQDGPAHLYNVQALRDCVTDPTSPYRQVYRLNLGLTTNWSGPLLLVVLQALFAPATAEKLLVTGYIVFFAAALRYAVRGVRAEATVPALLGLPLILNYFLHMGFYSFALSLPLFLVCVGCWIRSRAAGGRATAWTLGGLGVAICVSHVLTFVVTAGVLVALALSAPRARARQLGRLVLGLLPASLLTLAHALRSPGLDLGWRPPRRLLEFVLVDNPLFSWRPGEVLVSLALVLLLLVLGAVAGVARRRSGLGWRELDVLLLVAAGLWLAGSLTPERLGDGGYVRSRLVWFSLVAVLLWLAAQEFGRRARVVARAAAVVVCLAWLALHASSYRRLQGDLSELLAAREAIAPGSTLLALRYSNLVPLGEGTIVPNRVEPILHAAARIATAGRGVLVNNYEASTGLFPLRYREGFDADTMGKIDAVPPCAEFLAYAARTGRPIDFVLLWGYPDGSDGHPCTERVRAQLEQAYDPVPAPGERVRLYARRVGGGVASSVDGDRRRDAVVHADPARRAGLGIDH